MAFSASIDPSHDATETSVASNLSSQMCDEASNDRERSEVVDAHDGANVDTRGECEEGVVSTNDAANEENVGDDEEGNLVIPVVRVDVPANDLAMVDGSEMV